MKKSIIFISLALLMQSCITYTDKNSPVTPESESFKFLETFALEHLSEAVEITDFFDRYQDIRNDRTAAVNLGKQYYKEHFNEDKLFYEEYDGEDRGRISATQFPDLYIVRPSLPDEDYKDKDLQVKVIGERRYRITSIPYTRTAPWLPEYDLTVECTATVNDENDIIIESLDIRYHESENGRETTAHITSTADVTKIHICTEDGRIGRPYTGTLDFDIAGQDFTERFAIRYSENDNFEIL